MSNGAEPVPTVVNGHTFTIDTRYNLNESRILGKGSFGVVCTAFDSVRKINIAIKRIRPFANDEWDARHTLREIRLLKLLGPHPNIVTLYELSLFESKTELYMMMELMDCDLHRVIQSKQPLTEKHHKCFIKQVLEAIKAMHSIGVFHRDLKPGNILVSKDCQIRITDFGLARFMDDSTRSGQNDLNPMTEYVVTRWYRCPELLLSPNRPYSEAIDLWSIGCILAELIKRKPLFPGKSHAHQVQLVFEVVGYSSPADLGFPLNAEAVSFLDKRCRYQKHPLKHFIPEAGAGAMDLLEALLAVNPVQRPSAAAALAFPFLSDAEILNDYSANYLTRPTPDYFDFEHEKYSVAQLKELIEHEVHTAAASAYRFQAQKHAQADARPSHAGGAGAPLAKHSDQHTSSYDLRGQTDDSDGPVSQLATQVKNARLPASSSYSQSSYALNSSAASSAEVGRAARESAGNPFSNATTAAGAYQKSSLHQEGAAINNGNILTAVRNDQIGGHNPAIANSLRSARKTAPKTPTPRKIDQIMQKDLANKHKALVEKDEEASSVRSETSQRSRDSTSSNNLYSNIFARRGVSANQSSGSSVNQPSGSSAASTAATDPTSRRFGRLMSAFPSLPGGSKVSAATGNAITNSGRVYRGSVMTSDTATASSGTTGHAVGSTRSSAAMMHSGSNVLHHDF